MFNPLKRYTHWLHTRWPAGVVEKLPESGELGVTNLPGVRIVGDLTGIPLLKFSSKTGARSRSRDFGGTGFSKDEGGRLKDCKRSRLISPSSAAACPASRPRSKRRRPGSISRSLKRRNHSRPSPIFPKAKPIYTYPTELKLEGGLQFTKDVKEALLEEMEEQRKAAGIEFTDARIERLEERGKEILLHHGDKAKTVTRARRVIVAIGRSGNHRKLGCPGEDFDQGLQPSLRPEGFHRQKCARRRRWRQRARMRNRARRLRRESDAELSQTGIRPPQAGERRETQNAGARSEGERAGGTAELGKSDDGVHERDGEEHARRLGHARARDHRRSDRAGQGDSEKRRRERDGFA